MKKHLQDSLVIGFALFSMFFGAGNVIFPLIWDWNRVRSGWPAFFSYFMADIGLALLAMFAILRQGSPDGITARIGRIPPQRSCAPLCCASAPCWLSPDRRHHLRNLSGPAGVRLQSGALLHPLLSADPAAVRAGNSGGGHRGKDPDPALLIGLLILIVVGVVNPIGPVGEQPLVENVAATGVEAGYQTMDVLAAIVFGYIILKSAREKGHDSRRPAPGGVRRQSGGRHRPAGGLSGADLSGRHHRPLLRHHRGPHVPGGVHCPEPVGAGGHHPFAVVVALACVTTRCGAGQCMRRLLRPLGGRVSYRTLVRHLRVQCRGIQLWSQWDHRHRLPHPQRGLSPHAGADRAGPVRQPASAGTGCSAWRPWAPWQ